MRPHVHRLSLKQKLPLLTCGLLLAVVVADTAASYRSVRDTSLAVGLDRLRSVTDQLAGLFTTFVTNTEQALRTNAGDGAIARYLRAPTGRNREAALAAMRAPRSTGAQTMVVELWNDRRRLALSSDSGAGAPHGDVDAELREASTGPRHVALGRLRIERDKAVVPMVAAVLDGGRPIGYYVEWRRISSDAQARDQLLRLIGPNSALLLGNDSGNVWTDLATAAAAPATDARAARKVIALAGADGRTAFGLARPVVGAPWLVFVELPASTLLVAADQFLQRSALVGLVVLLLGFVAAWMLSRTITAPLKRLTDASAALASGDLAPVVSESRSDELGQLAAAFNSMAAQVRETTVTLEERVMERTRRLEHLQAVMLRTERLNTLATLGAGLAHDLNNLIFSIGLASDRLRREAAAGGPPRAEVIDRIATATAEASRLAKRLMAFARSGDGAAEPMLVDVRAAVAAQEALLRMLLPRTIGLRMILGESRSHVRMPATLVEQALVNLVSNARDAMPNGGQVTIHVREERDGDSPHLLLEVSDTGQGIAPELQASIFEMYFSTKAEKGTGIGLASVRALMESVGGTVSVTSALAEGATFRLSFPIDAELTTQRAPS